jgi:hypothetical protein
MVHCQHLCKWVYDALAAQIQHVLSKSRSSHEAAIHSSGLKHIKHKHHSSLYHS